MMPFNQGEGVLKDALFYVETRKHELFPIGLKAVWFNDCLSLTRRVRWAQWD